MSIVAASLVAQVSVQGAETAQAQLLNISATINEAGEEAKGTQSTFGDFLKSQLVFTALSDAVSFLKDTITSSISSAIDYQQIQDQTAKVLKSTKDASGETASSIADLAEQYSTLTYFNKDTVQSTEDVLLTFTNIGKSVFPDATKATLDLSKAMGEDTKSAAIQLGKALNDPLTGITALSRVGVTFTATQKAMITQMMAAGNAAGAQKIILTELEREFGGSANATSSYAGQMTILGDEFDNFKESLGTAVLPLLSQFLSFVTSSVMPGLQRFSAWFQSVGVPAIQRFVQFVQQNAIPILAGLAAMVISLLVPAFAALSAAIDANPISLIIMGIALAVAGLVAAFEHFYNTNAGFKAFIDGVVSAFKNLAGFIGSNLKPALADLGAYFQAHILPALQQIGAFLLANFMPVWKQLQETWSSSILPSLKQLWATLQSLLPVLKFLGEIVGGAIVIAFGVLWGVITGIVKALAGVLSGLATFIGGIVQFFTGLVQFISGILKFIVDLCTGNFGALGGDLQQIWTGIQNMFAGSWKMIQGTFQAAIGLVTGLVSGFVQGIKGFFVNLMNDLVGHSIIPDMVNGIISWFTQLPGRALSAVGSLVGRLTSFFGGLAAQAVTWGLNILKQLATGIVNGISSTLGTAMNAVGNFIKSHLPSSPAKMGPLVDLEKQGSNIPAQIAAGMQRGMASVQTSLNLMLTPHAVAPALASTPVSSVGVSAQNQPIILQVDGRTFARVILPHVANQVRYSLGTVGI